MNYSCSNQKFKTMLQKSMLQKFSKKINTFLQLSFRQKFLFFVNFILCGMTRLLIHCLPFKRLSPYFGQLYDNQLLSTILSQTQLQQATQIKHSIRMAAKYTPWHSNCLTQALVAKFWCQRLNIPYIFYIGIAKDSTKPTGYSAHAWLTTGPIAITGGYSFSSFQVISSYVSKHIFNKRLA